MTLEQMTAAEFRRRMDAAPISITLEIDTLCDLSISDLWPDGDAPDVITADVVKALMGEHPQAISVVREWYLPIEIKIRVDSPNPHWSPSPPILPELAPQPRIVTTATVS